MLALRNAERGFRQATCCQSVRFRAHFLFDNSVRTKPWFFFTAAYGLWVNHGDENG